MRQKSWEDLFQPHMIKGSHENVDFSFAVLNLSIKDAAEHFFKAPRAVLNFLDQGNVAAQQAKTFL